MSDVITTEYGEQFVTHHFRGPVVVEEVADYIYARHETWLKDPVLWDLSEADLSDVSIDDWFWVLAETYDVAEKRRGLRTAVLSINPLHESLLVMLKSAAKKSDHPVEMAAFTERRPALAWLLEDPSATSAQG